MNAPAQHVALFDAPKGAAPAAVRLGAFLTAQRMPLGRIGLERAAVVFVDEHAGRVIGLRVALEPLDVAHALAAGCEADAGAVRCPDGLGAVLDSARGCRPFVVLYQGADVYADMRDA